MYPDVVVVCSFHSLKIVTWIRFSSLPWLLKSCLIKQNFVTEV